MLNPRFWFFGTSIVLLFFAINLAACAAPATTATSPAQSDPNEQPTPATAVPPTSSQSEIVDNSGGTVYAVDLFAAWVEAGAPEKEAFDFTGIDGNAYQATFEADILPLFTENNLWFEGAQACSGCHFAASENSYHQLDLSTYQGILTGADSLENPPGVSILGQAVPGEGDFDWEHSKLRERMRNNRMPPGWEFDITEGNRNGPCVEVSEDKVDVELEEYGCETHAVGLIGAWVEAGAPDGEFEYGGETLTFERDVLPFFTENSMWFDGSQACTGCHFAASENSYHQLDLSTYQGILTGADSLESPPGVSILGQAVPGEGGFDWEHSKLRERLRNNRMPPGWEFDITEENRNGPLILAGQKK